MASIVLASAGAAAGSAIGGAVLGVSATTIGGAIGSLAGSAVDSAIVNAFAPDQRIEGARLDTLRLTTSTEGAVIPRVFGRFRVGGNIVWATDFREESDTETRGGKGGGPEVARTTYSYFASFAVAICEGFEAGPERTSRSSGANGGGEGPKGITGIGRVWADGDLVDTSALTMRVYPGDEDQAPDPFIAAKMGAGNAPAYRGTAYVVFEEIDLAAFGNRVPQFSFEVYAPLVEGPGSSSGQATLEERAGAMCLIPASGEFVYATEEVRRGSEGETVTENAHVPAETDFVASLDQLEAALPNVGAVSMVVSWFGLDLRAGQCAIAPGVESAAKKTSRAWSVSGIGREGAHEVSLDPDGDPVYGGTPADSAVVQGIQELKARGFKVTFYPFLLMDVPPENALAEPYSDEAASSGQPAYPWRGRITVSPAAGYAGTADQTADAAAQVAAFFGAAQPGDFTVEGESVTWTGPAGEAGPGSGAGTGLRRMILHYAHLCAAAGGVNTFLIGSELRGVTRVRSDAATYPAVAELRSLAAAVRSIVGPGTKISYAADWSEYFGHRPSDGSSDVFFHLDPLWADADIDFVGVDNYVPLADWRSGRDHADFAAWGDEHVPGYLEANILGGEGYDWFYASAVERDAQVRTAVSDGAYGKPWVFRYKDFLSWWANTHYDRPGGVEAGTPTAWVPESKPIRFTELGCPAIDRGPNQPNVFYDPKSSESQVPHYSRGWRDDAIQRRYLDATLNFWADPANNPQSSVYAGRMLDMAEAAIWTWDARPYPQFPARTDVWSDGENWRLGHWLTGRAGSAPLAALLRALCRRAGLTDERIDVSEVWQVIEGQAVTALESPRATIATLARHFGLDAVETGGRIAFRPHPRKPAATLAVDDVLERSRGQETELPQALKWTIVRADEEYDTATVEARRITVGADRVASEQFQLAAAQEEAERRARRALMAAWVGRETLTCRLPPSRLALAPGDAIELAGSGSASGEGDVPTEYRITSVAHAEARAIEAVAHDPAMHELPPSGPRITRVAAPARYGAPLVHLMDLPQLDEAVPAAAPYAAVYAEPWYGRAAVRRSASGAGFTRNATVERPARTGTLAAPLPTGPLWRFDHGAELVIDLRAGKITSVIDLELFDRANVLAVESAPGAWEIVQAGTAELIAPGHYRLTRLLRGQRGSGAEMGDPAPTGAAVVVLGPAVAPLDVAEAEIGRAFDWRVGPKGAGPSDPAVVARSFTPAGRGLRPFPPAHARARRIVASGDVEITWLRRSRAFAADNWERPEVPLAEEAERYDLEITPAGGATRTVAGLGAPAFTYTAAQQAADGGGPPYGLRVWQLGALGRGAPHETTIAITEAE